MELKPEQKQEIGTVVSKPADPADAAAGMMQMYLPRFNAYVDRMSKKGIQKLTKSLIAYTVEDMPGTLVTKEEREAFIIGVRLLEAKSIMYLAAIRDKLNETGDSNNGMETNSSGQSDQGSGVGETGVSPSKQESEGTFDAKSGSDT